MISITPDPELYLWRPGIPGRSAHLAFLQRVIQKLPAAARCVHVGVGSGRSLVYCVTESLAQGREDILWVGVEPWGLSSVDTSYAAIKANSSPLEWEQFCLDNRGSAAASKMWAKDSLDFVWQEDPRMAVGLWAPKVKLAGIVAGLTMGDPPEIWQHVCTEGCK